MLYIVYGTETNTSKDVAERLSRLAEYQSLSTWVSDMNQFTLEQLADADVVVFVCSTTGDGVEPANMRKFWKSLLRKSIPLNALSELRFSVIGLGDSSYAKYNFASKKLYRRLLQLGAVPLTDLTLSDDQHPLGIDGVLDAWILKFWAAYASVFPRAVNLLSSEKLLEQRLYPASLKLDFALSEMISGENNHLPTDDTRFLATVLQNRRLTHPDHFQDVRHIVLDLPKDRQVSYEPLDVAEIYPKNNPADVDRLIAMMEWSNVDQPFLLKRHQREVPDAWRGRHTVRTFLTEHLNIGGTPRRYFFEQLSYFVSDPQQREKLKEYGTAEGQEELYAYCHRMKRTVIEILSDFHSAKVPFEYFVDMVPQLLPRPYSISSAQKMHPHQIHLTVAIVKYKTRMQEPRKGVCSQYLADLPPSPDSFVRLSIRRPGFVTPKVNPDTPLILVGPGTGCAPIRALLQHYVTDPHLSSAPLFYFGCRHRNMDHLYKEDMMSFASQRLLDYSVAFSRHADKKEYVQDIMSTIEQSKKIAERINAGGRIYVSGRSKQMPDDIKKVMLQSMRDHLLLSDEDALQLWKQMEKDNRIVFDTWS